MIKINSGEDIINLIKSLSYNGLDLKKIRSKMDRDDKEKAISDVMTCLISYMKVGNNPNKMNSTVVDKNVGNMALNVITNLGIMKRATDSETLTLPRIALAFLPSYLLLRKFSEDTLDFQIDVDLDVIYMDIAFCGVNSIWADDDYKEFYGRFNELIAPKERANKRKRGDDGDAQRRETDWQEVASNGYRNDSMIHGIMNGALKKVQKGKVTYDDVRTSIIKIFEKVESMNTSADDDQDMDDEEGAVPVEKPAATTRGSKSKK
jgi:hypothetical protein